jgi:hypothetical protein
MGEHGYPGPVVHLVLPTGGARLSKVIAAQQAFLEMGREVARSVAGTTRDPVVFAVVDASLGSIDLHMTPAPVPNLATMDTARSVARYLNAGVATLQRGPERPPYFTDRALEKARDLASLVGDDLPSVGIRNGAGQTDVTKALAAHVDTILHRATLTVIGTVEGRIESLTVHERRAFSIYDVLTGDRIECSFGQRILLATILGAIERRVRVHGAIRYRDTGEIVGVLAETLQVLPEDDALPSALDVYGLLSRG